MTAPGTRAVRLARNPWHALRVPGATVVLGVATIGIALLSGLGLAIPLAVAGAILAIEGTYLAVRQLSVRLEVEPGVIHVRALGVGKRYRLGERVGRVRKGEAGEHWLRSGRGLLLGYGYGRATLADGEPVEIVRLAPGDSMIVISTDRGQLGVVAADEGELIAALQASAAEAMRLGIPPYRPPAPPPAPAPAPATGLDRAARDDRLVDERSAALACAAAERATASLAARQATLPATRAARPRRALPPRRRVVSTTARPGWMLGWGEWATVIVPTLAATVTWVVVRTLAPTGVETDVLLTTVILAGPGASVAAYMAIPRWPRLSGLTTTTAVAALLLVLRAAATAG